MKLLKKMATSFSENFLGRQILKPISSNIGLFQKNICMTKRLDAETKIKCKFLFKYFNRIFSTKGEEKEYYTLGCLLYFLKNQKEQHGVYVKQAGSEGIPVVSRPDRKDLEFYLTDPKSVPSQIKKIDKSVRLNCTRLLKADLYFDS